MMFPYDVRGIYDAPARDIGQSSGHTQRRSVTAKVMPGRIVFRAKEPPENNKQDVAVMPQNKESTGYTEPRGGVGTTSTATVRIDGHTNYGDGDTLTPIVFTGTGGTVKRKLQAWAY